MITKEDLKDSIQRHLYQTLARAPEDASKHDWWLASCCAVNDLILQRLTENQIEQKHADAKRVYYFSMEYLLGRLMNTNADNLDLRGLLQQALQDFGQDYEALCREEEEMGLGNGGLGRLAACLMDSLATANYPSVGYGILYEFGQFRQRIVNHKQEEVVDNWLKFGNPWRLLRPGHTQTVQVFGRLETYRTESGEQRQRWVDAETLLGIPWDIPIVGYRGRTVNFLRLWEAQASQVFDLKTFNEGGYINAVRKKVYSETVSQVLYPSDRLESGKKLRFIQEYFFVACSLKDILHRYKLAHTSFDEFPDKVVIQLNDTHPAIAIPELMRLLIDEEGLPWERAWKLCRSVFAYTNHTVLQESLERWSVPLIQAILPRHMQLIFEINQWFLDHEVAARWPGDQDKRCRLSLIEEGYPQYVRMAYLSIVGSFSVNGVAQLHTQLLKTRLFPDFHVLYPNKFNNKTNGITPRRWLKSVNPRLADLITATLGQRDWLTDLSQLKQLESQIENDAFLQAYADIKRANKEDLVRYIQEKLGLLVDPQALFDVQIKRFHAYKRQHLKLLHLLKCYHDALEGKPLAVKRVMIFAGKAAPDYFFAKVMIHAINVLAQRVNEDPRINDALKIVFLPGYGVTLAGKIVPAADLSEQISTAGKEASGTGNMKLGLNGACTIGTLDGANVEMVEQIGRDHLFIFGHTVDELEALQRQGYRPYEIYQRDAELKTLLDWMNDEGFCDHGEAPFRILRHHLLDEGDPFFVLADFHAYCEAQQRCEQVWLQPRLWRQKALFNTARLGYFSSDRTVSDYVRDIWKLQPLAQ